MTSLQTLNRKLKKLLKLMKQVPPRPIENAKDYVLFLEILKKISLFLNEMDDNTSIRDTSSIKEQIEGCAQYARVIEAFIQYYETGK